MTSIKTKVVKLKARRVFLKKGTCSRTMFYLLNREFGNPLDEEEQATDLLAGGILQQGYQCGLLWGSAFGAGAEAYRRCDSSGKVNALAINAARDINKAFKNKAGSADCEDIIGMNITSKNGAIKMLTKGTFVTCLNLTAKWAPEAIKIAHESLARDQSDLPEDSLSCASELVKKMGGSEKETAIVAGLAGGIGLSGNGCGALSAAIWMKALNSVRKNEKISFSNPGGNKTLEAFLKETDYKYTCGEICDRKFENTEEHTDFIKNGGCSKLIAVLAKS